ncbi:MAG: helix-turn-helix domain-containing protein [Candidatus Sulfotelmatobacter sp.]
MDAAIAARYLSCSRKHVLRLSDQGLIPAHPLPGSTQRRTWRYLLTELHAWMLARYSTTSIGKTEPHSHTMRSGSPRKGGR